ncbi:MAG: hypothetical protein V4629_01535 [Pseudomonadota bacterium]
MTTISSITQNLTINLNYYLPSLGGIKKIIPAALLYLTVPRVNATTSNTLTSPNIKHYALLNQICLLDENKTSKTKLLDPTEQLVLPQIKKLTLFNFWK